MSRGHPLRCQNDTCRFALGTVTADGLRLAPGVGLVAILGRGRARLTCPRCGATRDVVKLTVIPAGAGWREVG